MVAGMTPESALIETLSPPINFGERKLSLSGRGNIWLFLCDRVRMRAIGSVEAIATRATFVPGIVLHMRFLTVPADTMGANPTAAFRAAHSTTAGHLQGQFNLDRFPAAVCV